ncbi:hypothetical protein RvY_02697 [Ramazzottius varieornatus]|uniref:Uncharacterized protein n=1 Tax=Ramazzottius varieornatus TaxID=947166 RepID=A0A1D1UP09_RAMVA|nr:hypothetical protein RvY_02697 [Ramazzottius varieornatus]
MAERMSEKEDLRNLSLVVTVPVERRTLARNPQSQCQMVSHRPHLWFIHRLLLACISYS